MFGATSTSKRYGRGSTSVAVDKIFQRQPSSDPFLFDSDEEDTSEPVETTTVPATKKTKVRYVCIIIVDFEKAFSKQISFILITRITYRTYIIKENMRVRSCVILYQ